MRNARRTSMLVAAGAAVALFASSPALAEPQPAKEIAAAAQHAGFAAGSPDIAGVHTHLHHAVNCLVGPDGEAFAPKELNPCKAIGNGAIPDTEDADTRASLESALETALAGIAEEDLGKAKTHAIETQQALDALK